MKPPQFTECSVCGREFGSKSIVIHEPQCLQRLRRTEIAQQEQESSSSSSNKKNPRKKKKSSERKQDSQFSSSISSLASSSPVIHYSPPQSFVLLTTTSSPKTKSSNYITSMEKFNLPRIPINNFPSSAPNSNRPSTAVLEKPRILNPDYMQYDMSLTRIDFTGMPLGTKDENLNLRRPQTQTMDNPSVAGRHGFILPTVVDVIPKPTERITTKLTEACSLLPSANITTTIDSSLGDLQKRTLAPAVEGNPGTARGGAFHYTRTMDLQQYVHDNDSDLSGYPPETSSSSSQAFFDLPLELLPVRTPSATSTSSSISSSPPPRRPTSRKPLSPPVESLFAPPQHPFYFKLSQCDLEKPLRTIFHREKMTANRESYGTHPDNFLTPRPSSNSTPAGPRRTPPIPHYSPPPTPVQPDYCQDQLLNSSSENELQHDIRSLLQDEQSEPQHEIAKQFQHFTQDIQRHYKYKGTTQDLELRDPKLWPVNAPVTPGISMLPGYSLQPDHGLRTKDSLNWIGEPFMKPFTYYKTPFVKEDNNPDSESESYATPAGESQEELELDAGSETENNQESVICLANLNKEERIDPEKPHTPFNASAKESRTGNGGNDDIKLLNIEQAPDGSLTSRTSSSISEIIFDASSNQETVKCLQQQSSTSGSEFSDTIQSPRSLISVKRNSSISQLERRECSSDTASGDKATAPKTKTIYNFLRRGRHKETMTVRESGSDADDEDQESQFVGNPYSARKRNHQTLDHVLGRRISSTSSIFASRKSRDCSCANPAKPQLSSHILQEMYQDLLRKNEMKRSMTDDADSFELTPNQADTPEKLSLNSSLPGSHIFHSIASGTRFSFSSSKEKLSQDGVELPLICSTAPHRPSRQGSQPSFEKIPAVTSSLGFKNPQTSGNSRDSVNLPQMPSKPPSSGQYSLSSVNLPSIHSLPNYVKPTSTSYETLPSVNRWSSQKWGPESLPFKQHVPSSNDCNTTICMEPQNLEFLLPLTSTSGSVLSETDLVLPLKDETLLVHIDPTKFELAPPSHTPDLPKRPHNSIPESHIRPDADNLSRSLTATLVQSPRFQVLPELQNSAITNFSGIPAKKSARTRPRTLCLSPNFAQPHIQQRPVSSPAYISPTHDSTHKQQISSPKQSSEKIHTTVPQQPVPQLVLLSKQPLEEAQIRPKKNEVLTSANRRFQNSRQKDLLSSPYWNPLAETVSASPKPKDYTQRYPKWFSLDPPWKPDRSQIPTRIRSSRSQISPRPLRNQISRPQSQPSSDRSHPVQSPRLRNLKPRGKRVHFSSPPPPSDQSLDIDTHGNCHHFSDIDSSKESEPEAKKTKLRVKVHGFDRNRGKLRVTIRNPPNSPYDSGNDETFIITGQDVTSSSSLSPADEERSRDKTQYSRRGYTPPPAPGKTDWSNYPKEQVLNAVEKLEVLKDKIRNREFDRRKRGRDENTKRIFSSISMFIPPLEEDGEDEAIDLKIIVRRTNKDGSLPPLESVLKNFSTKWTYLIIDEQPLTHNSPNNYISAHVSKETAQSTKASKPLKITTSNQSSINSLSDGEAATRFLTCYICGQSVNVRDFMDHEEQCRHDLARRNANLKEDEKRILPEKPRGTISIQRWNDFAISSLKLQSLFVHCPHCGMTYVADNLEDHNLHVQTCVNAPPPEITSTVTVGKLSPRITVEVANDAAGWVVPTIKELQMPRWSARENIVFKSDVKPSSNNLPKPVRHSNPASRVYPTLA